MTRCTEVKEEDEATVTGPASGELNMKGVGLVYVESKRDRRRVKLGR